MLHLPFQDNRFDKFLSVTAIEFIEDAGAAVQEAFRVTKPGGSIVVATLNRLSPWASRRIEAAKKGHTFSAMPSSDHPVRCKAWRRLKGL